METLDEIEATVIQGLNRLEIEVQSAVEIIQKQRPEDSTMRLQELSKSISPLLENISDMASLAINNAVRTGQVPKAQADSALNRIKVRFSDARTVLGRVAQGSVWP